MEHRLSIQWPKVKSEPCHLLELVDLEQATLHQSFSICKMEEGGLTMQGRFENK